MYLGKYATFTLQFSYSHDANVGHLVKSRAYTSFIQYNRLTDETGGMASYEVDLPVAGTAYVIGNIIEQSPTTQNDNVLTYGEEPGNVIDPDTHLFVVNNTFLNDDGRGTFIHVAPGITTAAFVENNIFEGGGTDCDETGATLTTNFDAPASGDPMFVDQATYNVRLLAGSPCIDKGTLPAVNAGQSLAPAYEYVHPESGDVRDIEGSAIDIGAYEYGNPDAGLPEAGVPGPDGGSPQDAAAGAHDGGTTRTDGGAPPAGRDAGVDATGPVTTPTHPIGDAGAADGAAGAVSNSGGCGCRAARSEPRGGLACLLLPLALLARRRRSRGERRPRASAPPPPR
jgi:hypothetical protein